MTDQTSRLNGLDGVQAGYDRWAEIYDQEANPLIGFETPVFQALVGDPQGLRVLDLGCGTGRHSLWLAERGATVIGLDLSPGMLAMAQAKRRPGLALTFCQGDLHASLPFPDASFELLVSGLVLEHIGALPAFFAEVKRVLCSGGRAVITTMHPAMFLKGSQARFVEPSTGESVAPGSLPHSVGAIVMAAVQAGFTLTAIEERATDEALIAAYPRVAKYADWPLLLALALRA